MKKVLNLAAICTFGLAPLAFSATPAVDPLTKLALYSPVGEVMNVPESQMCKSKMQSNFYTVMSGKNRAVVDWYGAHLPGFRKTHAFHMDRSQDAFYNADGTVVVSVTSDRGKSEEDLNAGSVVYSRLQPGLSEKEIVGLTAGHIVCQ